MTLEKAAKRLSTATTSLIIERPFLGVLALTLNKAPAEKNCPRTISHSDTMYYNPQYILSLSPREIEFTVAHEVLHCALLHFARRSGRDKALWDIACDFAVNSILLHEGMDAPPGALYNPLFDGMCAEEIYPCLEQENRSDETLDQHNWDDDDTQSASLEEKWQQRLTGALQQAMQANKLSPAMQRMIGDLLEPKLPWRTVLAQYMSRYAREDYSYIPRPSNRREGPAIYPSLKSDALNLVIAVDTSASVNETDITQFISEINAIKSTLHARTTLLACDNVLRNPSPPSYEPWDALEFNYPLEGGGGTRFTPVFDWVEQQDVPPDVLVYFTDALGSFPQTAPDFPVLWLVKGKADVPWGQRIALN